MSSIKMELYPIGAVRSLAKEAAQIEVYEKFLPALKGIEKFSHLWVLFWMHKVSGTSREVLQAHPMGNITKEKRGVFALRSPVRPNPIGLTRVKLIERRKNVLVVEGLDALDGTPVLDIKPYRDERQYNSS
jgi:dUTP pyrophosphatase